MKRIVLRVAGAAVALAVLATGYLWLHGDFRRWDNEARLDSACDGLLDRAVVQEVFGDGDVTVRAWEGAPHHVRCEVVVEDGGRADVRVTDDAGAEDPLAEVYLGGRKKQLAVPVGHGWTGLFGAEFGRTGATDEADEVTTVLVLRCTAGGTKALTVTVETGFADPGSFDDPAVRPAYTRIAEATARKADEVRGCKAELGTKVRSLPLPVRKDEYKPLAEAEGTCAGIASVRGVRTVLETARGGAPYERCQLNDARGGHRYGLEASFGPYAQAFFRGNRMSLREDDLPTGDKPAHHRTRDGRVSWTTAACPDGTALFTLFADGDRDDKDSAPVSGDRAQERAALKTFAERAAKAHNCRTPAVP
ncbi:hypothetical protein [Streptomyces indicus]|uniref:Uncharacterized protein n=1 Tax=Streptomyces indicus TaxID=417292 RepID=A0A1G8WDY9_9ACTN|nr:hypothetical protein [Streptomyces indicus]SDJ75895.1 hypothetical protein SAMN05421806_102374 [Streptomyces indicus]